MLKALRLGNSQPDRPSQHKHVLIVSCSGEVGWGIELVNDSGDEGDTVQWLSAQDVEAPGMEKATSFSPKKPTLT